METLVKSRNSRDAGEFEVHLKAPNSAGKHDIQAHFDGGPQYKSSDSTVDITVKEPKVSIQKTTVTTNQQNTDEEQTDEECFESSSLTHTC